MGLQNNQIKHTTTTNHKENKMITNNEMIINGDKPKFKNLYECYKEWGDTDLIQNHFQKYCKWKGETKDTEYTLKYVETSKTEISFTTDELETMLKNDKKVLLPKDWTIQWIRNPLHNIGSLTFSDSWYYPKEDITDEEKKQRLYLLLRSQLCQYFHSLDKWVLERMGGELEYELILGIHFVWRLVGDYLEYVQISKRLTLPNDIEYFNDGNKYLFRGGEYEFERGTETNFQNKEVK